MEPIKDAHASPENLEAQNLSDLRYILASQEGQRFIATVFAECGLLKSSFSNDPQEHAFNAGRHYIALQLFKRVQACNKDMAARLAIIAL